MAVKQELDEIEEHHQIVIYLIKTIVACLILMTISVCACCVIPWKFKYSRPQPKREPQDEYQVEEQDAFPQDGVRVDGILIEVCEDSPPESNRLNNDDSPSSVASLYEDDEAIEAYNSSTKFAV